MSMVLVPSPVHEATSALPQSADNIGSTLCHLVKPRIEIADSMLADEKRSVEGLFQHPRLFSTVDLPRDTVSDGGKSVTVFALAQDDGRD